MNADEVSIVPLQETVPTTNVDEEVSRTKNLSDRLTTTRSPYLTCFPSKLKHRWGPGNNKNNIQFCQQASHATINHCLQYEYYEARYEAKYVSG